MKFNAFKSLCLSASFMLWAVVSHTAYSADKIEIQLEGLLAPYRGYDNTNNIEITLHGNLPNPCYQLDKYKLEKNLETHTILVRQFARRKLDGVCGESVLPEHMKMLVPFSNVISLGALPVGTYTFQFTSNRNQIEQKTVEVKEAHKTTVDDYPYAAVSNAMTTDVIQKSDKMDVTLSGVFTSSCAYLDKDSVKLEKQNDVYVVLPVIKMKTNLMCIQSLIPFAYPMRISAPGQAGHYLVHVRSMNGKSINRVFEATEE